MNGVMPRNPSSLSFEVNDKQLFISREGRCTHRISVWPRPNAEGIGQMGSWERIFPEFRLISYPLPKPKPKKKKESNQLELGMEIPVPPVERKLTKSQAYDQLRQTLPPSYGIALAPFKSHQWNMIVYLSKNRRFYELLKGNPCLSFILANDQEINLLVYKKELTLDQMTGMKQQKLLELIDLPGTKALAQILRKIRPASAHLKLRGQLKYCLQDDKSMKKLAHLKTINSGVLYMLGSTEPLRSKATPQLLEEVSHNRPNDHYPSAAHQLRECLRWHNQLYANQPFPRLLTLEALSTFHEELAAETNRLLEEARLRQEQENQREQADREKALEKLLRKPFHAPPIKGTPDIIPLQSAWELRAEGQQQHNCVGSYTHRVESGQCYIYRVLKPQRATLSIVKTPAGEWAIGELNAICNSPADDRTRRAVYNWLNNVQLGI